ncbi:MAG: LacI family DNA-binding transcriptional regulator [Agathobacter sp.]
MGIKKNNMVAVLHADSANSGLTHDFFAGIMDSFKRSVENKGYNMCFLNSDKQGLNRQSYTQQVKQLGIDGILISCIEYNDPEVTELLHSGIPIVTVDEELEGAITVKSDNVLGIKNLVRYIIEMGHKRIAYILGDDNTVTSIRLQGFYEVCEEMGITVPDCYIRHSFYRDMKQASFETEQLMRLKTPPTCILYPDDFAAIGGINILRARGLNIPKDISVAGYDGIRILAYYEPRLTTIKQNTFELGQQAALQLISYMEAPETVSRETVVVDTTLQKGRTVGKFYC